MKDFKYIIKRILIGVGISLVLGYLRGNLLIGVKAKEISPVWKPFSNNILVVSNVDENATFTSNGGSWSNWGYGILRFNFSVTKVSGSSIAPTLSINNVAVNNYTCNVSSTSAGNSTFTSSTFSAECPMIMGSSGLTGVYIGLTGNQQNEQANYRIVLGGLFTFEKVDDITLDTSSTNSAINNQTQNDNTNTQNIINNNNTNTQTITDNQDSNTQDIINNQNTNTDKEIESQRVCSDYDLNKATIINKALNSSGELYDTTDTNVTDFLSIDSNSKITLLERTNTGYRLCFYDINKSFISCSLGNMSVGSNISVPNNASYFRYTVNRALKKPVFNICRNGNQAITEATNNNTNAINNVNDTINNDNVDNANTEASNFFSDFQSNSHGLSGIITSPLRLIESLSSSQCSSLILPLPFVSQNATLPCMSTVYNNFPTFYSLWQLISTGLIAYYILINLFAKVHSLQNPQDDRIEVLNL